MTEVRTRPGTIDDVPDIAAVHRWSRASYYGTEAEPDDGREVMWSHLLAQPERVTHVAEVGGLVVGFMSAVRVHDEAVRLEMTALYVLPDHHDARVGSTLHELFDAERRADEEGVLEVWQGNRRAIAFYLRRGWTATAGTRPGPQDIDYVTYRLPAPKQA